MSLERPENPAFALYQDPYIPLHIAEEGNVVYVDLQGKELSLKERDCFDAGDEIGRLYQIIVRDAWNIIRCEVPEGKILEGRVISIFIPDDRNSQIRYRAFG